MELTALWQGAPEYRALRQGLAGTAAEQLVVGLQGSERAYLAAALLRERGGAALWLAPSPAQAERLQGDLRALLPEREVLYYPEREVLPFEVVAESTERMAQRVRVHARLLLGVPVIVVASLEAALGRLTPPDAVRAAMVTLRRGQRVPLDALGESLLRLGYVREERVDAPGQFAMRGSIVDIFGLGDEAPVRADFFDDEIDTLRRFDPETQRSLDVQEEVTIGPASELVLDARTAREGIAGVRRELHMQLARLRRAERVDIAQRLEDRIGRVVETWGSLPAGQGAERFHAFFYPEAAHLVDYLPEGALTLLSDPERAWEAARAAHRLAQDRSLALLGEGAILPRQGDVLLPETAVEEALRRRSRVYFTILPRRLGSATLGRVVSIAARPVENFHGQWSLFHKELQRHRESGHRVVLLAATEERLQRLRRELRGEGVALREDLQGTPEPGEVVLVLGELQNGFHLPGIGLWLLTDGEIFGREKRRAPRQKSLDEGGQRVRRTAELRPGDYVVHVHHGIGKYLGMRAMEIEGVQKEYLHLSYAQGDKLYVPVEQIDLVQKYVGQEGQEPHLYRLGGSDWQKVKSRVQASVREMAEELLRLYAQREAVPGYAFSPDGEWMQKLEDSFPYEETPDQRRAIEDVKRDMGRPHVMDRLLCGDVGYGKTEVAVRAAFKAAMDGKQVAVLVPTTILAQQHFATFQQRFSGFPVAVDLLSRFRSAKEQADVLRRLKSGAVDVVIGTHRLLAQDVQFHDLGLVVVDEEQRFGVRHKEKLKSLKTTVDVLTLTATPIPRTLHMGLVSLRDMSTIDTPPEDRFPVQTYVAEWDEELVQDAVRRELGRGGQIFYVHNRVQSIESVQLMLERLVPEARVAIAHGQMPEQILEKTMLRFLEGEYDVLLATTIIESGLDMPRVNTLVVEDADRLGLSQLYQLRGRIGRSNRLAYAYFTYRRDQVLSEVAEKRLEAIREFTEFGAGFKLAMRDLEIRGAGNILGPEQHGFIIAVGFDLYTQMLDEAVKELKGEAVPVRQLPSVDLPVDAYVPSEYIADPKQKIEIYKRLATAVDAADAQDLLDEVEDRFGPPPPPLENLFRVARIRLRGEEMDVAGIRKERDQLTVNFHTLQRLARERLKELPGRYRGRATIYAGQSPYLSLRVSGMTGAEMLLALEELLDFLLAKAESA
ncbi:MAG: transcription-repair coupling factor [Thermaerobacter sp.]|nr:transcription-repair coupling factor [Thermaerobacter sp.]